MNIPILYLFAVVVAPALVWLALWVVYLFKFRPDVQRWFGEWDGYRRDHAATRRRRDFENRCWWAAKFFYGCYVVGLMHEILRERLPDLSWLFWSARLAVFLVGLACVWAAVVRFRTPDES